MDEGNERDGGLPLLLLLKKKVNQGEMKAHKAFDMFVDVGRQKSASGLAGYARSEAMGIREQGPRMLSKLCYYMPGYGILRFHELVTAALVLGCCSQQM